MKCKTIRKNIILYIYDELNDDEKIQLEEHLAACPECSQEMEDTQKIFRLVNKAEPSRLPQADWEKCWQEIRGNISPRQAESKRNPWVSRWALAAAAAIFVFVAGIFIGRMWISSSSLGKMGGISIPAYAVPFQDHLGSIEPVLLDYSNRTQEGEEWDSISMDKTAIKALLLQNYVLKQMVAHEDPQAAQVLDDLELVLREIVNMPEDEPRKAEMIRNLISKRSILFKMDVLRKI